MGFEFTLTEIIPAPPGVIYRAWLDSQGHSRMTGSPAQATEQDGGAFSAWDGYIWGHNLELEPERRIVQAWRSSDFDEGAPDSRLEVLLEAVQGGTRLTLHHSELPDDGDTYRQGWIEFYFEPMKAYFGAAQQGAL